MKLGNITKQPAESRWVSVRYDDDLDDGDEVSSVLACTADPSGLSVTPVLATIDRVRVFIEGGDDGATYKITLRVATSGGEILEDELVCKVKEI